MQEHAEPLTHRRHSAVHVTFVSGGEREVPSSGPAEPDSPIKFESWKARAARITHRWNRLSCSQSWSLLHRADNIIIRGWPPVTSPLEHGLFLWPPNIEPEETLSLTSAQLSLPIEGVDWRAPEQRWRPAIAGRSCDRLTRSCKRGGENDASRLLSIVMEIDLADLPDNVETLQRMVRTLATERANLTEAQHFGTILAQFEQELYLVVLGKHAARNFWSMAGFQHVACPHRRLPCR